VINSVDTLQIQVDTIEGAIGSHAGQTQKLKSRLDRIETNISAVDARVTKLESSSTTSETTITDIDVRISSLEKKEYNEMILDGAAENLAMCGSGCTDCRKGYYSLYPKFPIYQCVDRTEYMYGDACVAGDASWSMKWCSTDMGSWCHKSFPVGDPLGYAS